MQAHVEAATRQEAHYPPARSRKYVECTLSVFYFSSFVDVGGASDEKWAEQACLPRGLHLLARGSALHFSSSVKTSREFWADAYSSFDLLYGFYLPIHFI